MKRFKAFTLVELMVVMAIISFLSVGAYAGLTFALRQGRDTQRRRIVDQIQTALIAYYSDYSEYPGCPSGSGTGLLTTYGSVNVPGTGGLSYKACQDAFTKDEPSLIASESPIGLHDYFENEFKWGPIENEEFAKDDMQYYFQPKGSDAARKYTVCVALENPKDPCYCVGSEATEIACAGLVNPSEE